MQSIHQVQFNSSSNAQNGGGLGLPGGMEEESLGTGSFLPHSGGTECSQPPAEGGTLRREGFGAPLCQRQAETSQHRVEGGCEGVAWPGATTSLPLAVKDLVAGVRDELAASLGDRLEKWLKVSCGTFDPPVHTHALNIILLLSRNAHYTAVA